MREKADRGKGIDPLDHGRVADFFGAAIVKIVKAGKLDSHPLYGAHDFEGSVIKIAPDPDAPSVDRQVAVVVELTNFGEKQRATFLAQADPTLPGAPLRIVRVEHAGWMLP